MNNFTVKNLKSLCKQDLDLFKSSYIDMRSLHLKDTTEFRDYWDCLSSLIEYSNGLTTHIKNASEKNVINSVYAITILNKIISFINEVVLFIENINYSNISNDWIDHDKEELDKLFTNIVSLFNNELINKL